MTRSASTVKNSPSTPQAFPPDHLARLAAAAKDLVQIALRNHSLFDAAQQWGDEDGLITPPALESQILEAQDRVERLINPQNLPFGTERRLQQLRASCVPYSGLTVLAAAIRQLGLKHDELLQHYGVEKEISTATDPKGRSERYNWFIWPAHLEHNPPPRELLDALEFAADEVLKHFPPQPDQKSPISAAAEHFGSRVKQTPRWDKSRRELWLGDQLCKKFRRPAENQESILNVFEEEGWPSRIDDPIPRSSRDTTSQPTGDACYYLSKNSPIKFERDGKGQGVLWSLKTDSAP
jgi:hypothetical protein